MVEIVEHEIVEKNMWFKFIFLIFMLLLVLFVFFSAMNFLVTLLLWSLDVIPVFFHDNFLFIEFICFVVSMVVLAVQVDGDKTSAFDIKTKKVVVHKIKTVQDIPVVKIPEVEVYYCDKESKIFDKRKGGV